MNPHRLDRDLSTDNLSKPRAIDAPSVQKRIARLQPLVRNLLGALLGLISGWALAAPIPDLPVAGPGCPAGGTGGLAYLSQSIRGDNCDATQVQNLIFQLGQTGTLVVDRSCVLNAGLRLPSRFVLKGMGIGVTGILAFTHDGIALSGCPEEPHGYITIADLDIYGPNPARQKVAAPHATGIALSNQHIVSINNLRISDFVTGIYGRNSFSVFIKGGNISDNRGDNIRIGYNANGWRIRDSILSRAGGWGVNVLGPGDDTPIQTVENGNPISIDNSNDLLIDGTRMEYNSRGAVRTNTYGSRITSARLESNGNGNFSFPNVGLLVDQNANETRILTNLFSGNCIRNKGSNTQRAFNIPTSFDTEECELLPIGIGPN